MRRAVLLLAALLATAPPARAAGDVHLLVASGLPGEPQYGELFRRWAGELVQTAKERLGVAPGQVRWLAGDGEATGADGVARRDTVLAALGEVLERSGPGDTVAIVLIGHGTARDGRALFNLPGPDLSADDLAAALEPAGERRVVVVNTAPASAPFVQALSAPGRVVISATGSGAENRHTRFAGPFVEALGGGAADADKDGRVSLLEAFEFARREVARLYEGERRLQTEHALLDDDGDGRGTAEPGAGSSDGGLARSVYLAVDLRSDGVEDPRVVALEAEARDLLGEIRALKSVRVGLGQEEYDDRLETLLLALAHNRRALRGEDLP